MADERDELFDDDQPSSDKLAATPFDNIEGAHEYVRLLASAIAEAEASIQEDIALAQVEAARVAPMPFGSWPSSCRS